MTIKELNQRLRLLEPEEKISITAGEVRALLNYSMALVVEEIGTMVSGVRIGVRTNNEEADSGPAWEALCSVSYYIQDMPHFDKAKEYGEWPCTMELDD